MSTKYEISKKKSNKEKKTTELLASFVISNDTSYWIFVLTEINWEDLKKNFMKKELYITSFGKHPIKQNDIVLLYQKHTSNLRLHGFVGACQIMKNIGENNIGVTIFKDFNMAKYISSISAVELFNEPYKTSTIDHMLKIECSNSGDFTTATAFNSKYTKEKSTFLQLSNILGHSLLKNLISLSDNEVDLISKDNKSTKTKLSRNEKKSDNFNDAPYSSSESEFENDEPYYSSDSDSNLENEYDTHNDVRVVIGHIPILFEPCNEFDWNKDEYMTTKSFKKHFLNCNKCIKTDNNECNIFPFVKNSILHCTDMKDDKQISACLEYYHNQKICKFELEGNDRKNDHIYIFRLLCKNSEENHMYHNQIIVMW